VNKTNRITKAIVYLLAILAAEIIGAFFLPSWEVLCHSAILTVIIVHAALADEYLHQRLVLPLAIVPLLRIVSLTLVQSNLPQLNLPQILLYHLSYIPVLVAAVIAAAILGYTANEVGLSIRRLPIQLVVGLTGIVFGVVEYFILVQEPLIAEFMLQEIWLPAVILLLCTGFVEEFIFRGVLQLGITENFKGWGIPYVSLLFASTYIGFLPEIDLVFIFAVALWFGWIVRKTGSLLGVALSRGVSNVMLYLIVTFVT